MSRAAQVSVIVPCYNAAEYLRQSLDSVLGQEGVDVEVVAVNDGSTDRTAEILEEYGDRIQVFSQANAGPSVARNLGASHATGDCLAFFDADDVLLPGALRKLYSAIEGSGCAVAYGEAIFIDNAGDVINGKPIGYRSPGGNTMRALCAGTLFQPSAGMFRRSLFEKVNGFDVSFKGPEDLDLQYRCSAHTEFTMISDPVLHYRLSSASLTRNYPRQIEQTLKVHRVNARRFGLWRRYPRHCFVGRMKAGYYFCAEHLSSRGRRSPERIREARRSLALHPWLLLLLASMPVLRCLKRALVSSRLDKERRV